MQSRYKKLLRCGEAQSIRVYKALDKTTRNIVCLKQIRLEVEDEGFDGTIRRIGILRELRHPNIILLYDVIYIEKKINLVFEWMNNYDLKRFLSLDERRNN